MARPVVLVGLTAVAAVAVAVAFLAGPTGFGWPESAIFTLRLHRVAAALLAGGALSVAGVLAQGLFRNPMADAAVLGTNGGALLGAELAIFFGSALGAIGEMLVPLGALLGALGATALVVGAAPRAHGTLGLVLMGFLVSALTTGLASFVLSLAALDLTLFRAMSTIGWTGLGGVGVSHLAMGAPLVLVGWLGALGWSRTLDVLLSGEREAQTLGVPVRTARRFGITWIAVLGAASLALGGTAPFLGLAVPHALRRVLGETHGPLLFSSFFVGGAALAVADAIARSAPTPTELPLPVVTGFLFAPIFFVLLRRVDRVAA